MKITYINKYKTVVVQDYNDLRQSLIDNIKNRFSIIENTNSEKVTNTLFKTNIETLINFVLNQNRIYYTINPFTISLERYDIVLEELYNQLVQINNDIIDGLNCNNCLNICYFSCNVTCHNSCNSTCASSCYTGCQGQNHVGSTNSCNANCNDACHGDCSSSCISSRCSTYCVNGCYNLCDGVSSCSSGNGACNANCNRHVTSGALGITNYANGNWST
ncbi:MAG: hypothetical protein LBF97_00525 [Elusimicrobiota bacterium]|nr:hypothetical protein [Elusimicrobiota bacterium]